MPKVRSLGTASLGREPITCCLLTDLEFFLFVKYDLIRAQEWSEKPYAFNLLISKGGYNESNALDMSVDNTLTMFLLSTACFNLFTNPVNEVSQQSGCDLTLGL